MSYGRLAAALAKAGRMPEAADMLRDMQERQRKGETFWVPIAFTAVALGKPDLALQSLERAVIKRDAILYEYAFDPIFDPIRSDPRFVALWRSMGLPPESPDWR